MFDDYGRPTGYGQNQPYLDTPNYSRPEPPGRPPASEQNPLQSAIAPAGSVSRYPVDPTMVAWRSRPKDVKPEKLAERQHWGMTPPPPAQPGGMATGQLTPTQAPTQDFSRLSGFDATKFNDPNKHDVKYDAGRIFSQFAPSTEAMPQVLSALRGAGMNVDQTGKDSFDFHDGYGPIDVGFAFGDPNAQHHWQWLPRSQAQASPLQSAIFPAMFAAAQHQQNQQPDDNETYLLSLLQSLQQ